MIEFVVIERIGPRPEDWRGHGSQEFAVAPRKGDVITKADEKGIEQAYEVTAVVHSMTMTPASTAGDLIIRRVGTSAEWRQPL